MFPRYFIVWPGWIQINRESKNGFGYVNHSYPLNAKRVKWLQLPEGSECPPFDGRIIATGYSIGEIMQPNKNKVGRPRNPDREAVRQKRRFYMLEKNDSTAALLKIGHAVYRQRYGKDGSDAAVLRDALAHYQ